MTAFQLMDESDAFLRRLAANARHDLDRPTPLHPTTRRERERLIAKCQHVLDVRDGLREVYGAQENGTDNPFLAWRLGLPPSYSLALHRDRVRGTRGRSSLLAWPEWGLT